MGVLERESKKRTRKNQLQKAMLQSVAAVGLLSVDLLAPNAIKVMKTFGFNPYKRQNEVIRASRQKLVAQGYLKWTEKGFLQLTEKGKVKLHQLERQDYRLPVPRKWDNKWRVLIFDISEKRGTLRAKVRNTLRSVGFTKLQKSVWVYPYDCEDFITLLKADLKIGKDVLYMIVDSIENDKALRTHFNIK